MGWVVALRFLYQYHGIAIIAEVCVHQGRSITVGGHILVTLYPPLLRPRRRKHIVEVVFDVGIHPVLIQHPCLSHFVLCSSLLRTNRVA